MPTKNIQARVSCGVVCKLHCAKPYCADGEARARVCLGATGIWTKLGNKKETLKQAMLNIAKPKPPYLVPSSKPMSVGLLALKQWRAIDKPRYCHIRGSPYQVKNLTHHNCFIGTGISRKARYTSVKPLLKLLAKLPLLAARNAAISSGGYSSVLYTVHKTDAKTAKAPIKKEYLT